MLTYQLEKKGRMPAYEFLYKSIREDILSGRLCADDKLPSKRALAQHLGISVTTVENAYQQLISEGCVVSRPRSGVFVAKLDRLEKNCPLQQKAENSTKDEKEPILLDLAQNMPDAESFPFSTWAHLTREVLSDVFGELFSPVPNQGLMSLRCAIADDLRERKGMSVSPHQIVVGAGAEYLYLLLAQLLGRDAVLAVEDPGYPKIKKIYEQLNVPCVSVLLDEQGVDTAYLKAVSALHISPSHHYPTGVVTPIGRRQELLKWARENKGIIIEDDYDSEFRFSGRPLPTLQSIDRCECVIYMNTFSQTISPSMRMGFMVLPPRLLKRYKEQLYFYSCTVPALEQQVLSRFLSEGFYERHIFRMKKKYRIKREEVLSFFKGCKFVKFIDDKGAGLHFLVGLKSKKSDEELQKKAESMGINLAFLSDFASLEKSRYEHILVVNYASLKPDSLKENAALLEELFSE